MKRNIISDLKQRSRWTFLKYRAPCAAARSLAANGRSPPRGPPTAASPALWGAAPPPSAPALPHVSAPTAAAPNRADQVPWPPIRSSGHSMRPDQPLAACSRPQMTDVDVLPSDTSWLFEPTTGVHQFGGGSVAHSIAEKIQGTLTPREAATPEQSKVVDPNAHELYLKGRYFWNKRTGDGLKKAIANFKQAIELDPASAEAYAGLADAYALSGDWEYGIFSPQVAFSEAKTAAAKALALDNKLSEAHTSLAFALDLYGWDWNAAEAEYKVAIKLNPNYATAHQWYAWHLILMGKNAEGISELEKAESLDPLSLIVGADLADALCIANLLEEAIQQSKKTLELDQHFAVAHYALGQALEKKQRFEEAISEFQKAIEISGHSAVLDSSLAHAYAISGHREDATRIANDLESQNDKN